MMASTRLNRETLRWLAAVAGLAAAFIFLFMVALFANAAQAEWVKKCYVDIFGHHSCERKWVEGPRYRATRKVWRQHDHHRSSRDTATGYEPKCRPHVAVVGDQYVSEEGARGEADKAWMQTARWQWGERYMARENAREEVYECGRSSVGSVAGQIFYRCRLNAKPCRPDQRGD